MSVKKEKQLIVIIPVPSYKEKKKKSTGSIKKNVIETEVARKLLKAMRKP